MKLKLVLLGLALVVAAGARADYTFSFTNGVAIPDNVWSGYQDSSTLSGVPGFISDVNVTLNLSGAFNGDLYAWLSHDGGLSILLNRVGRSSTKGVGYGNSGFGPDASQVSFMLNDQASGDVHFYRFGAYTLNGSGQLTGLWQPDGRILDPESAGGLFDGAARTNLLNVFNGMDPNGGWTLFVADLSSGGVSTLTDWSLQIAVVPEPRVLGLWALGLVGLLVRGWQGSGARQAMASGPLMPPKIDG